MARLRRNFTSGTITDNPLTSGATTINSANFANLPVVASPNTMSLILDPLGAAGVPEVVLITAHTAGATSVTVSRGQETAYGGGAARQHAQTTMWIHAVTTLEQMVVDGFFRAKATSGTTTSCPTGGYTKVTFDTVGYDPNGNFASSAYTVPVAGLYAVHGFVTTSGGSLLNLAAFIDAGTSVADGQGQISASNSAGMYEFYDEMTLIVGNVVDLRLQNVSGAGSATVLTPANRDSPRFSVRCLALA